MSFEASLIIFQLIRMIAGDAWKPLLVGRCIDPPPVGSGDFINLDESDAGASVRPRDGGGVEAGRQVDQNRGVLAVGIEDECSGRSHRGFKGGEILAHAPVVVGSDGLARGVEQFELGIGQWAGDAERSEAWADRADEDLFCWRTGNDGPV
jgi:hypothetical protein